MENIANEEYTPEIVSIVDEEGKEHVFEELDRIETDSGKYIALLPLPENPDEEDDEADEMIILRVSEINGDTYLEPIEDDAEFDEVGKAFEERLSELFDIEGQ